MTQGIKEKDIRDFEKYAQKLADVIERIRKYRREANAYLAMDELHLMSCDFHEFPREKQRDFSVASVTMTGFDGGDW